MSLRYNEEQSLSHPAPEHRKAMHPSTSVIEQRYGEPTKSWLSDTRVRGPIVARIALLEEFSLIDATLSLV